jgi:hypothetical protein
MTLVFLTAHMVLLPIVIEQSNMFLMLTYFISGSKTDDNYLFGLLETQPSILILCL